MPDEVRTPYRSLGYVERDELLRAEITLPEGVATEEDFFRWLNQRHRYTIRKALKKKEQYGLRYEEVEDFGSVVDQIYPLYIATWKSATDMSQDAIPKGLFEGLSREQAMRPCVQLVRDQQGGIIAFGLTLENDRELWLWLVGMDYALNRDLSLIYHIYWQSVARAIRKGIRHINLGVTTYFVKETFGAVPYPTICFTRSQTPVAKLIRFWKGQGGVYGLVLCEAKMR